MKKVVVTLCFLILTLNFFGQTITQQLQKEFTAFERDSQLKHAISSLYIIDANTGQVLFDKNSQIGLAPASTQKIITSVTAFELLGKDYRYKTLFGYVGKIKNRVLQGDFYLKPSGDPTLGSWRWKTTNDTVFYNKISEAVRKINIIGYNDLSIDNKWTSEVIPDGWIWQDIGNYYGAGASGFSWIENQFDIVLKSGERIGDPVTIVKTKPRSYSSLISLARSEAKGTGDNAYVYYPQNDVNGVIRGTIPINENAFVISAANPHTEFQFQNTFNMILMPELKIRQMKYENHSPDTTVLFTNYSPSLDSIIYWFNKKSINLYGEALIKTFAYEKTGFGSTDTGVAIVKKFWKQKGMDESELNIVDGSGLSPLNRVTTHAQVEILKYAKAKEWFPFFFNSLPEYNGMKIKSGTIRGVKGFCGYHKAKNGKEYIFSFLVNNYNGSASSLVNKMYKVLDIFK
jgi:D-alanyl-D-alanine carboxypeptidase/D-alanyl-D-alanine-endopeptidase (penicillin-binding protein 4)